MRRKSKVAFRKKLREPGYEDRIAVALGLLDLPAVGVGRVGVYHDQKCGLFAGRPCNCVPDISITTGDGHVAVVAPDGSVSRVKQS